jgi:hypothetical protein
LASLRSLSRICTLQTLLSDQQLPISDDGNGVRIEMTTEAVTNEESRLAWVSKLGGSVTIRPGKFTLNGPYFKQ